MFCSTNVVLFVVMKPWQVVQCLDKLFLLWHIHENVRIISKQLMRLCNLESIHSLEMWLDEMHQLRNNNLKLRKLPGNEAVTIALAASGCWESLRKAVGNWQLSVRKLLLISIKARADVHYNDYYRKGTNKSYAK